ncbi:hypothetical protein VSVS12_02805 [Vibrio scophthalmi]|uniref:OmpA family protein n=1 Tax=Vibrio scophthalmi TaxID=45658 RepID=UPI00080969ED|nr:OmpA family protein [Vibrio scophthalmi]ANS86544.1 hypothetical protein VSVS12_02805 [Vibrio scophthalmi]
MKKIISKIYPMLLVIASFTLEAKPPIPTPTIGIGSFSGQDVWGGQLAVGVQFDELANGYIDYQSSEIANQLSLMVDRQLYITDSLSLIGSAGSTVWLDAEDVEEVTFEPLVAMGIRYDWSPYVAASVSYRYPITQDYPNVLEPSIQVGLIIKPFYRGDKNVVVVAERPVRPIEVLPIVESLDDLVDRCDVGVFIQSFYFTHDSAKTEIRPEAVALMQASEGTHYTVIGHTDRSGSRDYNFQLGLRRAEFAKQVMMNNGVGEGNVSACSRGEFEANEQKMGSDNALQRRVDIYYHE